jgi:glycosyltransferase involved in cell wall biosynthesis
MTSPQPPLISIVVPSFNQGKYIGQTIESIIGQSYPRIELIIMDAGSTDDTRDVVRKYESSISHFVSEPDRGQADAVNKGFRVAKGDICSWINSDDMYMPGAFAKAADLIGSYNELKFVYGGSLYMCEGKSKRSAHWPPPYDAEKLRYRDYLVQPSTFWTRALWEKTGGVDDSFQYALDWEFFVRASKICPFIRCEDYLAIIRIHPTTKTTTGGGKRHRELVRIVEMHGDEDWAAAYRDVARDFSKLTRGLALLKRLRLYRLRQLFFPRLYLKHGTDKVECAFAQFQA